MIGAIIGDIAGSRFEWHNKKSKDFDLLTYKCSPTDDSVMSLAIAQAILISKPDFSDLSKNAVECMQRIGQKYPNAGYGGHFREWLYEDKPKPYAFSSDKYGRNFLGVPTQRRADFAFVAHILKCLKEDTGRCAILLPNGILNRYEENSMRKNMIQNDYVECVIGLGKNLFYNSPMEACILICRMKKEPCRIGQVLFVNAVKLVHREGTYSFLSDEDIQKIANVYEQYADVEGFSRCVSIGEILNNEGSLRVSRYVKCSEGADEDDSCVEDLALGWQDSSDEAKELYQALIDMLGGEE